MRRKKMSPLSLEERRGEREKTAEKIKRSE
jgi:hypothetical protein